MRVRLEQRRRRGRSCSRRLVPRGRDLRSSCGRPDLTRGSRAGARGRAHSCASSSREEASGSDRRGSGPRSRAVGVRPVPHRGRRASGRGWPRSRRIGSSAPTETGRSCRPVTRSDTSLRNAFASVLATEPRSMSIACTAFAPLRAELDGQDAAPTADVEARAAAAEPGPLQVLPERGSSPAWERRRPARRPDRGTAAGRSSRPSLSRQAVRREDRRRRWSPSRRGATCDARPAFRRARPRAAAMCAGVTPQQPPMIWAPSPRHSSAKSA